MHPADARRVRDRRKNYWRNARKGSDFYDDVMDLYPTVVQTFDNKDDQVTDIGRYWGMYNGELDFSQCQQYHGDYQMYVPIVRDGVNGLVKRGANMLFPESGHYTECIASDGKRPEAKQALLDHYVERISLENTIKNLLRVGYVEGQFSLYIDWEKSTYTHTRKIPASLSVQLDGGEGTHEVDILDADETDVEDVSETLSLPTVAVVSAADLGVWPPTADSIDDAIEIGGGVALALRVSKGWLKRQAKSKALDRQACETLIERITQGSAYQGKQNTDPDKKAANAAGVKTEGTYKYALVYQVWTMLEFPDGDGPELAVIHFGGPDLVLAVKRCPFWIEKVPILSEPDQKVKGSFFGRSRLDCVEQMQYGANDAMNIGMDSASYSLMPIFAADPDQNPQYNSMVISMAALWKVKPDAIKPITFPQMHEMALSLVEYFENRINQSLGLTVAAIPSKRGGKLSQAEVANEQMAQIVNTADEVRRIEKGILNRMLERFAEYDQQFRDEALTIEVYGELGVALKMEDIPPNQFMERYTFKWRGTQAFQSAQKLQQKMAALNVLRGIPPQMLPGKKVDIAPVIEEFVNETFGARVGRLVLRDLEDEFSVPPDIENQMLARNLFVIVHPTDNDEEHIQEHMKLIDHPNTPPPAKQQAHEHIQMHQAQIHMKSQAAMQQQAQEKGIVGAPGAAGQPGMSGAPAPRIGAVPGQGRMQGPPGMIHPDQIGGMPRKM